MSRQEHVIKLPNGSTARLIVVTIGLLRKRYDVEVDLSTCSREYSRMVYAEFSHVIAEKLKKRPIEMHFHLGIGLSAITKPF